MQGNGQAAVSDPRSGRASDTADKGLRIYAIPVAILVYGALLVYALGPSGVRYPDPGYHYLFNSLNLAIGLPIEHVDHPGTPLQILGAVSIRAVNAVVGEGSLPGDLIEQPGVYVRVIFASLMVLYAAASAALGYVVYRRTRSAGAALIVQALPIVTGDLAWLVPITTECLLVSLVAAILALVLAADRRSRWFAPAGGFLVGVATAVKLTAAPLLFVPLMMMSSFRQLIAFGAGCASGFLLSTSPIWPQYPKLASWVIGLATRQGRYGQGEAGFDSLSTLLANLATLAAGDLIFASSVVLALVLLTRVVMVNPDSLQSMDNRLLAGLALCGAAQFLLVTKQPDSHYMTPARAGSGLLLWMLIERLPILRRWASDRVLTIVGVAIAILLALVPLPLFVELRAGEVQRKLVQDYGSWTKVIYHGSSSVPHALQQGNFMSGGTTGGHYTELLAQRYPGYYFYNGWGGQIWDWAAAEVDPESIASSSGIVYSGTTLVETDTPGVFTFGEANSAWHPTPHRLIQVDTVGSEAFYEVASD